MGEVHAKYQPQLQTTDQQDGLFFGKRAVNDQAWFGLSTAQRTVSCKDEVVSSPHVQIILWAVTYG